MVKTQIANRDITHPGVLAALRKVPRHRFVPAELRQESYADRPLPIGFGQTISQPCIVALMTQYIAPTRTMRILEIGTGSGYQTAILAELSARVFTIELVQQLAERAATAFEDLHYHNIETRTGDGWNGWPEAAPFDAILVTAAARSIPPPLLHQLKDGGRMVIPLGLHSHDQELVLVTKVHGEIETRPLLPVRFVPFVHE